MSHERTYDFEVQVCGAVIEGRFGAKLGAIDWIELPDGTEVDVHGDAALSTCMGKPVDTDARVLAELVIPLITQSYGNELYVTRERIEPMTAPIRICERRRI